MSKINKPNLFVIGAAKAGTTSLYNYLKNHPEVYLSPIKEPNFFNKELKYEECRIDIQKRIFLDFEKYFNKKKLEHRHFALVDDLQNYLSLFREVKQEKVLAEFSTSYLQSKSAVAEIYKFNPKSKIVVMLREPVDRTISHYQMDSSREFNSPQILEDLKTDFNSSKKGFCISNMYIELSLYYSGLEQLFRIFPKEQIFIIRFENLKKNKLTVLHQLCDFLEIDYSKLEQINLEKIHNQTLEPKNKAIEKILKFKKKVPKPLLSYFKKLKPLFLKKPDRNDISEEIKNYIAEIVSEDYIKTNELIDKHHVD